MQIASTVAGSHRTACIQNGRGNIAMFQQIIKELNLYQANSELANFSYALSDWTDASNIKVVAEQKR